MSNAAAPAYLGHDLKTASPAMRFGLLLPIWTSRRDQENDVNKRAEAKSREGDEVRDLLRQGMDRAITALQARERRPLPGLWEKNDFAAREVWKALCALSTADAERMEALAKRQSALATPLAAQGRLLRLDAKSTAPFTTGLGNEHPLENGFAFLNPYGLPYLPGSGVKGVLRQAARELASGEWGDTQGWRDTHDLCVTVGKRQIAFSVIEALFGLESKDGDTDHLRGALTFWDVIPQLAGDSLKVEVMTPHQSHYYQKGDNPHDSGQPNPINFLTVPPGSGFCFHVQCNLPHLQRLAPDLAEGERWQQLLQSAFEHAFAWLGFGAKTAVGYGAMARDAKAGQATQARLARARAEAEAHEREVRLASLSPEDQAWEQAQLALVAFQALFEKARTSPYNPGGPFNAERLAFVQQALAWTEARSRQAAAELIERSATKAWGRPSNKDRWNELQAAIQALRGVV